MATSVIEIEVDEETARRWRGMDDRQRERLAALLDAFTPAPNNRSAAAQRLVAVMEQIGRNAEERGLTASILEGILDERE